MEPADAFLIAATVPRDRGHSSGTLDEAERIRNAHPDVARASVYAAAVLGDVEEVERCLAADAGNANRKGGPRGWDALTYLCFSRYLQHVEGDPARFVRTAERLLDAGASAATGWYEGEHQPHPAFESAIYGAAAIARNVALTKLLLDRGADPNDDETPYHVPETCDNAVMRLLVESGRLSDASIATMLLRKADWHDYDGIDWLLGHGANPNYVTAFYRATVLHHAILRDNSLDTIRLLLDRGADPTIASARGTAAAMAAGRGRADVLQLLAARGIELPADGVEGLAAACALDDESAIARISRDTPRAVAQLKALGGDFLGTFAGANNARGMARLIDLGIPATSVMPRGDGYWGYANGATVLHTAAWRASHDAVRLLIARGADVNARDGAGQTPLRLAVRACVDSYWKARRSPESVRALLDAGATVEPGLYPCGYDDVDRLLEQAGAGK